MGRTTVAVVIGTRPEAIKLAPVALGLARAWWSEPAVVVTGQHGDVVDETLGLFGVEPAVRLDGAPGGTPVGRLTAGLIDRLTATMDDLDPGFVVVQGDTASTLAGALAGFFRGTPVAHVEAGLRSGDLASPFPEEANRRLVAQVSSLHLAPTTPAAVNLLGESLPAERVLITGNTVVDALRHVIDHATTDGLDGLPAGGPGNPLVVVTAHRRESWGEPIRRVGRAVADLARRNPAATIVLAAHMNPIVRGTIERETVGLPNVLRTGPLPYVAFVRLLDRADLVLTDSGGIQEEAASLGVPTLVLRDTTERVEALDAGIARLVGTDTGRIVAEADAILSRLPLHADAAARGDTGLAGAATACPCEQPDCVSGGLAAAEPAAGPFGDGRAAERVVQACGWLLGFEERPADFVAGRPLAQAH